MNLAGDDKIPKMLCYSIGLILGYVHSIIPSTHRIKTFQRINETRTAAKLPIGRYQLDYYYSCISFEDFPLGNRCRIASQHIPLLVGLKMIEFQLFIQNGIKLKIITWEMLRLFCFVSNVHHCVSITKILIIWFRSRSCYLRSLLNAQMTIIIIIYCCCPVFYQKNLDNLIWNRKRCNWNWI